MELLIIQKHLFPLLTGLIFTDLVEKMSSLNVISKKVCSRTQFSFSFLENHFNLLKVHPFIGFPCS